MKRQRYTARWGNRQCRVAIAKRSSVFLSWFVQPSSPRNMEQPRDVCRQRRQWLKASSPTERVHRASQTSRSPFSQSRRVRYDRQTHRPDAPCLRYCIDGLFCLFVPHDLSSPLLSSPRNLRDLSGLGKHLAGSWVNNSCWHVSPYIC